MAYKTIFRTKPKKENKIDFCNRIVKLLSDIKFVSDGYIISGKSMLDVMLRYNDLNKGYYDIDDILKEHNSDYNNIFDVAQYKGMQISEYELLANIDLIINCIFGFKKSDDRYFYNNQQSNETIGVLFEAIEEYLLGCGYKIVNIDRELNIIESGIAIDLDDIKEAKIKEEVISFYDYKNTNDIEEKKKIIFNLYTKLESRKNDIEKIMGTKISDMLSNYMNNVHIRHNNIDPNKKSYYRKAVADLEEKDLIEWYNYIFAFAMNIYIKLDVLKDINVNNGYQ